jgi:hypothetical protein
MKHVQKDELNKGDFFIMYDRSDYHRCMYIGKFHSGSTTTSGGYYIRYTPIDHTSSNCNVPIDGAKITETEWLLFIQNTNERKRDLYVLTPNEVITYIVPKII